MLDPRSKRIAASAKGFVFASFYELRASICELLQPSGCSVTESPSRTPSSAWLLRAIDAALGNASHNADAFEPRSPY